MALSQKIKGQVRRGNFVGAGGVGAVIAVGEESYMIAGLDEWPVAGRPNLQEKRLARSLGVTGFRLPPATGKVRGLDIPAVRFPMMVSCPGCADEKGRAPLDYHFKFASGVKNSCEECGKQLVPSRFVMVCERGHIDEFPYFQWLHKGMNYDPGEAGKHRMKISSGAGAGTLADIVLSCSCGVTPRNMEGALDRSALKGMKACTGARPWLGKSEPCDCIPRGLQRGASNAYFSVTRSSLSIPPWSEGVDKILEQWWRALKASPEDALEYMIENMGIAEGTPFSPLDLKRAVISRKKEEIETVGETDLKPEEYDALCTGKREHSRSQDFVCEPAEGAMEAVGEWFEQVMLVKRLREVQALVGFTRILPPAGGEEDQIRIASLWRERGDWLPAVEVHGEGVFLRLNDKRLAQWERLPAVKQRAQRLDDAFLERCERFGMAKPFDVTARLVLVHTLAHVLMTAWSMDCGYPASALREKLYVSPDREKPMCGLLIYTASSDSAGSLGGLTLMGEAKALRASLRDAMESASWCSSDPLCLEAEVGGNEGLNGAACHACVLAPEPSCEFNNTFLDRAFLAGTVKQPELAYFHDLLEQDY